MTSPFYYISRLEQKENWLIPKKWTNRPGERQQLDRKKPKTANFIAEFRPWNESGPRFLRGTIRGQIRSVILSWRRYVPLPKVGDTSGYWGCIIPLNKNKKTAPLTWIFWGCLFREECSTWWATGSILACHIIRDTCMEKKSRL